MKGQHVKIAFSKHTSNVLRTSNVQINDEDAVEIGGEEAPVLRFSGIKSQFASSEIGNETSVLKSLY